MARCLCHRVGACDERMCCCSDIVVAGQGGERAASGERQTGGACSQKCDSASERQEAMTAIEV
jgi:hypothetical protein